MKPEMILKLADEWRKANTAITGGLVVFSPKLKPCGWTSDIRDARAWVYGCIAVDDAGQMFRAEGCGPGGAAAYWLIQD